MAKKYMGEKELKELVGKWDDMSYTELADHFSVNRNTIIKWGQVFNERSKGEQCKPKVARRMKREDVADKILKEISDS